MLGKLKSNFKFEELVSYTGNLHQSNLILMLKHCKSFS